MNISRHDNNMTTAISSTATDCKNICDSNVDSRCFNKEERDDHLSSFALPCRGNISKGKKRRAFANDGPLVTPDLQGGYAFCSGEMTTGTKNDLGLAEKSQASPPCSPCRTAPMMTPRQDSFASPPPSCSPRRTPMMTPRQDLFASPLSNELSRFGSLALQSPSSCFSAFSPGRTPSASMNYQSPSIGNLSSSLPRQSQRNVPISLVGSDNSCTPNRRPPLDSPGNAALASPKPRLTPHPKDKNKNKTTGLFPSIHFSSGLPCKEMTHPITFLDPEKIEKDAACSKQSLLSSSKEVDDFAFVFNSASDGSLTDDDDEGGWFFLRGPDNKDSTEDTKKAKNEHFSSPFGGVDRKQSSFNERIRVPTSLPSAGEQGNVVATLVSRSSSCNSRYSSSSCSSLFGMGIVHEHSQQSLADMGIRRFSPNLSHDKAHQMQNVTGRDLITPPVICTQASEPPEFKPKIRKTMIS